MSTETPASAGAGVRAAPAGSLSPADERRNFRLGVANGGMFQGGENLVDSSTVLPVLLSPLTHSNGLIGFAAALGDLGWMLPQIFAAPWVSRRLRQLPLYRKLAILRGGCLFALALAAWLLRGQPGLLLATFFVLYGIYSAGAGVAGVAFMELVGRTVRPERLGAFFAQRLFWGGCLGALAGLVARQVLRLDDSGTRFAILFGLSAVACSLGLAAFSAIREPRTPVSPTLPTPVALLRQGLDWMRREPAFRRLFITRAALSVWLSATPFLTLFAVNELGGGGAAAGTLLVSRLTGYVLSNLAWQRLSQSLGNRSILRLSTGMACALLLASAALAWASPWRAGMISSRAALVALELMAALGGAVHSGVSVAFNAALIEDAPACQRQGFVSVMYTFLGPTMLLPMLGGFVVDAVNAPFLFLVCGVACVAGYHAASRLPGRAARTLA